MIRTMTSAVGLVLVVLMSACGSSSGAKDGTDAVTPSVPLQLAVIQGNVEAIRQHVAAGSNLDEPEPTRGSSALITAATFGKTEVARALLEGGADVNYQNRDGSTALITAAFFCREEIVKALLDHGADKTIVNNAGRTALDAVSGPFEEKKPIYDALSASLGKFGLVLDEEHLKITRPVIAEMLR